MAVFGWIRLSVFQRKIQGGINFAFLFSGGLTKCFHKFRGALFIALAFSGGFFRSKIEVGRSRKKSGGPSWFLRKFRGAFYHDLTQFEWGPPEFLTFKEILSRAEREGTICLYQPIYLWLLLGPQFNKRKKFINQCCTIVSILRNNSFCILLKFRSISIFS